MNYEEIRSKCDRIIRFESIDFDLSDKDKFKVNPITRGKIDRYIYFPVSTVVNGILFDITFDNSYRDLVKFCNYSVDRVNITESILGEL